MQEQPQPKKWKMMLLSWAFIYPVINILFYFLFPIIQNLPQLLKTLILTLMLVPLMGVAIPKIHQRFWHWIVK